MTVWENVLVFGGMMVLGWVGNYAICVMYFRFKKREEAPDEIHKEVVSLREDVNKLRGAVKYLEGRLNGKGWLRES